MGQGCAKLYIAFANYKYDRQPYVPIPRQPRRRVCPNEESYVQILAKANFEYDCQPYVPKSRLPPNINNPCRKGIATAAQARNAAFRNKNTYLRRGIDGDGVSTGEFLDKQRS